MSPGVSTPNGTPVTQPCLSILSRSMEVRCCTCSLYWGRSLVALRTISILPMGKSCELGFLQRLAPTKPRLLCHATGNDVLPAFDGGCQRELGLRNIIQAE